MIFIHSSFYWWWFSSFQRSNLVCFVRLNRTTMTTIIIYVFLWPRWYSNHDNKKFFDLKKSFDLGNKLRQLFQKKTSSSNGKKHSKWVYFFFVETCHNRLIDNRLFNYDLIIMISFFIGCVLTPCFHFDSIFFLSILWLVICQCHTIIMVKRNFFGQIKTNK